MITTLNILATCSIAIVLCLGVDVASAATNPDARVGRRLVAPLLLAAMAALCIAGAAFLEANSCT